MRKYIGDRAFYKRVLALMIPIMVQNGITNFVSMLDNIMVGRLGTAQMSGVAVANQLVMVFNICIFGAVSGAGIFGAQFFGKGDNENVRNTFRFKLVFCTALSVIGITVLLIFGKNLSALYLKGEGSPETAAQTLKAATDYIKVIIIGFIPHAITQSYASTLRETDKAITPMVAGLIAVYGRKGRGDCYGNVTFCRGYVLNYHYIQKALGKSFHYRRFQNVCSTCGTYICHNKKRSAAYA